MVVLLGGGQVVVGRDHVHLLRPAPQVQVVGEPGHEVGGDRHRRVGRADDVALAPVALQQRVRAEPAVVDLLRRVGGGRGLARGVHLVEVRVELAPEGGAPGGVQRLHGLVAVGEPLAEGHDRLLAVAAGGVAAVLVVDVPEHHRRVPGVAAGQLGGDPGGGLGVLGRAGAVGLPGAVAEHRAVHGDRADVRVGLLEPGRGRGGGRRQVDPDPGLVQQPDDPVQPAEVVLPGPGLQPRPGEDAQTDQVDPGLAHQRDVLGPYLLRPLLRVVVAAVGDRAEVEPGPG